MFTSDWLGLPPSLASKVQTCKLYHGRIPKAANLIRIPTWKLSGCGKSLEIIPVHEVWLWILSIWCYHALGLLIPSRLQEKYQKRNNSGAEPDRFPPFYGNRPTFCPSDSKYPEMLFWESIQNFLDGACLCYLPKRLAPWGLLLSENGHHFS